MIFDSCSAAGFCIDPQPLAWWSFSIVKAVTLNYTQITIGFAMLAATVVMSLILYSILDVSRTVTLEDGESVKNTYDAVILKAFKDSENVDQNGLGVLVLTDKKLAFTQILEDEPLFDISLDSVIDVDFLYDVSSGTPAKMRTVKVTYIQNEHVKKVLIQLSNKVEAIMLVKDVKLSVMPNPRDPSSKQKVTIGVD